MTKLTTITAFIGHTLVTIFGYTSPDSKVIMDSSRVYLTTYSNSSGYFEFSQIAIPYHPSDLCFTSIDAYHRSTSPICIPPPPAQFSSNIGPVLLPPTISLDSSTSSGQAIPDSTVQLHLYQTNPRPQLVRPAQAFSLPVLSTQTDSSGNFSLSIPDVYASDYRLFATVLFKDNSSSKSNTLFYTLTSPFDFTWLIIAFFALTLILFIYLLYLYFHPKRFLPALVPIPTHCSFTKPI